MTTNVPELMSRNARYAAAQHVHRRPLAAMNTLVVSCLDPRTAPESFLGLGDGDALVMRNLGGRGTDVVCEQVGILAEDLERLNASPLVPAGLTVTGLRYDAASGRVDTVLEAVTR